MVNLFELIGAFLLGFGMTSLGEMIGFILGMQIYGSLCGLSIAIGIIFIFYNPRKEGGKK